MYINNSLETLAAYVVPNIDTSFSVIMQQSAAFKILKTHLKAVPSYSFNGEQLKRTPLGNPYQFLHQMPGGSQITKDGDITMDGGNSHNGINFAARLQQFQQVQHLHRLHSKAQNMVEAQKQKEPRRPQLSEINVPTSRSSSKRSPQV
ncbi:hypothetical protein HN51_063026, partial [Arachis hypogaea]|nr:uncharacterized protein DS421_11g339250 [Arachis hypogaea]